MLQQEGIIHQVDGAADTTTPLLRLPAPDEEWESYILWVIGSSPDGDVYVRSTGCPRGGECHPELMNTTHYLMDGDGTLTEVERLPEGVSLPGESLAPMPDEREYIRFSRDAETVSVRREADGEFVVRYRVEEGGGLATTGG